MKWLIFGAGAATAANDSQSGDKLLSMIILMVCFVLPVIPIILTKANKRVYDAVNAIIWAKIAIAVTALAGVVWLIVLTATKPLVEATNSAFIAANVAMVAGLFIMCFSVRNSRKE